jgi:hypothetical protein
LAAKPLKGDLEGVAVSNHDVCHVCCRQPSG